MSTMLWHATLVLGGITAATAALSFWWLWRFPAFDRKAFREASDIFDEWVRTLARPSHPRHAPRGLLVDLFMPPDRADDILCNLLGRYDYWVEVHGERWARIIFYLQSAGSIVSFWTDWLMKRLKLLKTFVSS